MCNPELTADEQRFWYAIIEALPATLLSRADEPVIERMAIAWSRFWHCKALVAEQGLLVQTAEGPRRNPLLIIERDARDEMHRCGEVLGLSPVARARITVSDPMTTTDPTELLLDQIDGGNWNADKVVPIASARKRAAK